MTIQFIGCGKLGTIFLELFLEAGVKKENISVITGTLKSSQERESAYGVQIGKRDNPDLVFSESNLNSYMK